MDPRSLFGLSEHLERLSKHGDPLDVLEATVDFEYFRGWLVEGLGYGDGSKGGRPPFDPVSMFKALILQAQHNLSDARTADLSQRIKGRNPNVVKLFFLNHLLEGIDTLLRPLSPERPRAEIAHPSGFI